MTRPTSLAPMAFAPVLKAAFTIIIITHAFFIHVTYIPVDIQMCTNKSLTETSSLGNVSNCITILITLSTKPPLVLNVMMCQLSSVWNTQCMNINSSLLNARAWAPFGQPSYQPTLVRRRRQQTRESAINNIHWWMARPQMSEQLYMTQVTEATLKTNCPKKPFSPIWRPLNIKVKVKVKESIVLREIHLRTTGRHLSIGSHNITCHQTEVTAPPSPQPGRLVLDLSTP